MRSLLPASSIPGLFHDSTNAKKVPDIGEEVQDLAVIAAALVYRKKAVGSWPGK